MSDYPSDLMVLADTLAKVAEWQSVADGLAESLMPSRSEMDRADALAMYERACARNHHFPVTARKGEA